MAESTPPTRDTLLGSELPQSRTYPLTSDTLDTDGLNQLTGITTPPATITAAGFAGNGYNARASGDLPAWAAVANAKISFHAIAKVMSPPAVSAWREVAAAVTTTTSDTPKFELAVIDDPNSGHSYGCWGLRAYNGSIQTKPLNRVGWRFEFRAPEAVVLGTPAVQALCWLDADTLLFTATRGSTSVLYRWDVPTQQYTGRASSTTLTHVNSLHLNPDGEVWMCTTTAAGDKRKRLDIATSFSTGTIATDADWNTGDVPTTTLSFAALGGVEYALITAHALSGTTYGYVFLRSQMGGTVNQVDRVKRWSAGLGVQDIVQRASDGYLYLSRSSSPGKIEKLDLAAILAGTDGATPTPVATYTAPTLLCEGVDFHPTTDRLWCGSEGLVSAADSWPHCSVWSSALGSTGEENSYLVDYVGGSVQIRLNGRLMWDFSHTPTVAPSKLTICAAPTSTAGQSGFLQTGGFVRSVAISSIPFTQEQFDDLQT